MKTSKDNFNPSSQLIVNKSQATHFTTKPPPLAKKATFFRDEDKFSRLEMYEDFDQHDPLNKAFVPPQGFKGPVSNNYDLL